MLIICIAGIGDMLLATPMLMELERLSKNSAQFKRIHVVTTQAASHILLNNPVVNQVFIFDNQASFFKKIQFVFQIFSYKHETIISIRSNLFFSVPFIIYGLLKQNFKWIAHLKFERFRLLRGLKKRIYATILKKKTEPPYYLDLHAILLDLLLLHIATGKKNKFDYSKFPLPRMFYSENETQVYSEKYNLILNKSYGVFQLAGSDATRKLKPDVIAKVLEYFIQQNKVLILLGSVEDVLLVSSPVFENLFSSHGNAILNWLGKTGIRETYFLIQNARFCIAPDSALMHMAATSGIPLVAIMGLDRPENFGPIYSQGPYVLLDRDPPCVQSVTPQEIILAYEKMAPQGWIEHPTK